MIAYATLGQLGVGGIGLVLMLCGFFSAFGDIMLAPNPPPNAAERGCLTWMIGFVLLAVAAGWRWL